MGEDEGRFEFLYKESAKFCDAIGLPQETIIDVYRAGSDWEFILKMDALIEAAAKEVVKSNVKGTKLIDAAQLEVVLEALPVNGRVSLAALLKAANCPRDILDLVDAVRRVRNAFAHNIRLVDASLLDVLKNRKDKSELLRALSSVENFDEKKLTEMYEKDKSLLRFAILDGSMRFLAMAYHVALK